MTKYSLHLLAVSGWEAAYTIAKTSKSTVKTKCKLNSGQVFKDWNVPIVPKNSKVGKSGSLWAMFTDSLKNIAP